MTTKTSSVLSGHPSNDGSNSFHRLMRKFREKGDDHTHVMLGSPYGKYDVPAGSMRDFWNAYYEAIECGKDCYVAETPGKEIPVLVDVDLKSPIKPEWKQIIDDGSFDGHRILYSMTDVVNIVATYQRVLKSILLDARSDAMTCVLLEKKAYEQTTNATTFVKNGFHLHFPKLFLDRRVQQVYLIPLVKNALDGTFASIGVAGSEFIDDKSVNVHWLMYGSKKPDNSPYVATCCFADNAESVSFDDAFADYVLPGNDDDVRTLGVRKSLPRILSIFLHDRVAKYYYRSKPSVDTPIIDKYVKRKESRRQYDQASVSELLEDAERFVDMMSPIRSDQYAYWMEVGWSLWNISNGDSDGFMLWQKFSERSPKFVESECVAAWDNMKATNYTIGTLKYFAKEDNPSAYAAMMSEKSVALVRRAICGGHNDLAKIMHNAYGNEFVNAMADDKSWLQFGGKNARHVWKPIKKGLALRERISCPTGAISTIFTELREQLEKERRRQEHEMECEDEQTSGCRSRNNRKRRRDKNDDDDDGSTVDDDDGGPSRAKKRKKNDKYQFLKYKLNKVGKILENCSNSSFKSNVMTECVELFRNELFCTFVNTDPYLVAFNNGVYDFRNDVFRDGKPEDYLSKCLAINYVDYGSMYDSRVMEIDDFFHRVFPDESVRNYFLDRSAEVFVGGNREKLMMFWTGDGDNAKSVTQSLFENMLGMNVLAIKVSSALITGKKQNLGSASPELARFGNGVRWIVMDEPNKDEIINAGDMKLLTGNDNLWGRDLYEKGTETHEIVPMFKLVMICNTLPGIHDADMATWNRVRVIPFESKFISASKCPKTYEEQCAAKTFPADKNFKDKLHSMLEPFAWYLIARWRRNRLNPPSTDAPEKVNVATTNYKIENDQYEQFIDTCVRDNANARIEFKDLCAAFRKWFRDECPGRAGPKRRQIRAYFERAWGELSADKTYWDGMCLIDDNEQNCSKFVVVDANPMLQR